MRMSGEGGHRRRGLYTQDGGRERGRMERNRVRNGAVAGEEVK